MPFFSLCEIAMLTVESKRRTQTVQLVAISVREYNIRRAAHANWAGLSLEIVSADGCSMAVGVSE